MMHTILAGQNWETAWWNPSGDGVDLWSLFRLKNVCCVLIFLDKRQQRKIFPFPNEAPRIRGNLRNCTYTMNNLLSLFSNFIPHSSPRLSIRDDCRSRYTSGRIAFTYTRYALLFLNTSDSVIVHMFNFLSLLFLIQRLIN